MTNRYRTMTLEPRPFRAGAGASRAQVLRFLGDTVRELLLLSEDQEEVGRG